jgi:hypothetical protein
MRKLQRGIKLTGQCLVRAVISGSVLPVSRNRTLAAMQKNGKEGSQPSFSTQGTNGGNAEKRPFAAA